MAREERKTRMPTSPDQGLRDVLGMAGEPREEQIRPSDKYQGMDDAKEWKPLEQDNTYFHPKTERYEEIMNDQWVNGCTEEEKRQDGYNDY